MKPTDANDPVHAIVKLKQPKLRFAHSLAEVKPGEVMAVDGRGHVLSPRWVSARRWAVISLAVGGTASLYAVLFGASSGLVGAALFAAVLMVQLRNVPAYRRAVALATSSRWEEAHTAFRELENRRLPRLCRLSSAIMLGVLDHFLGRHEEALPQLDMALEDLGTSRGASSNLLRWQATTVGIHALLQLGRLDEARHRRDKLAELPRSEVFELLFQGVELSIAFAANAPDSLPSDDVLHDWARAALGRTQFGDTLVSLAWAFHRRGHDDMARHLLSEATPRTPRSLLPTTQPLLHAWAEERRAAWVIESGEPSC